MVECVEINPFHFQQDAFHFDTPLISAEGSVRSNGPVTWDYNGERIFGQGCADGPGAFGIADIPGDSLVSAHAPSRNPMFGA